LSNDIGDDQTTFAQDHMCFLPITLVHTYQLTMVFSAAQNTAFFENGPQMNLPVLVRNRLQLEGLQSVEDLRDFREDELTQAFKNMRLPEYPVFPVWPKLWPQMELMWMYRLFQPSLLFLELQES
jgi:hypothetical protein